MAYIPIDFGTNNRVGNNGETVQKPTKYIPIQGLPKVSQPAPQPTYQPFTGAGYFPATDINKLSTDPYSGRPYQGYTLNIPKSAINPAVSVPLIDTRRVAAGFDPTKAQPLPKEILENPRMSEAASQAIKSALHGGSTDELDHIIALGLSGSNAPTNLQIQPGIKGGEAEASDELERSLIEQVKNGQISLIDAQNQLAKNKGITLPENSGQRSAVDQWLMDHPNVLYPLAGIQGAIQNIPKSFLGDIKSIPQDAISPLIDAWNGIKDAAAKAVVSFTSKDRPLSEKIGSAGDLISAAANVAFLPVTGTFNVMKDIPVVGGITNLIALPFEIAGAAGQIAATSILNSLPISQQDKDNLMSAASSLGALAAQLALGFGMEKAAALTAMKDTTTELLNRKQAGEEITPEIAEDTLKRKIEEAKTQTIKPNEIKPAEIKPQAIKPNADASISPKIAPSEAITPKTVPTSIETPTTLKANGTKTETPTNLETRRGSVNLGAGIEGVKENISNVADYVKQRSQQQALGKDLSDNYYQNIVNGKKIDDIMTSRILDKANISPEDQKAIYNWMENPKESITPEQKALYDENIKPLIEGSTKLYNDIKGKDIPLPAEDSPEHITRMVKGRGSFLDRLSKGFTSTKVGGLLSKTAGFLKKRTMMALEDENGDRVIVSIKDGTVTGWDKGEGFDMGKLKTSDYQALADKEIKPFQDQLEKLQKEKDILMATKGRAEASPVRLQNIDKNMVELTNKISDIESKYDTGLEGKVFVDSKGKAWKIADATTQEIEANTNVRYYKTPLVNELQRFNKLNQIRRAVDFLESTKSSLEDAGMIKKIGSYDIPENWKTTELPQFKGYLMPKRIANVLDTFYGQLKGGNVGALTKMNLFLRTTIFFNPLIHVPNILVHWVVNRGIQWASPVGYVRMVTAGVKAIRDVLTLNDDYVKALNEGAPLLFSETKNADLYKAFLGKASYEMQSDPKMMDLIKQSFGLDNPMVQKVLDTINPYKISGKVTWAVNDIATLQAIYEEIGRGKSWSEAITDVGKHIPNYRLPAELFGSKQLMDAIKNPNLTMFSAYHYGALKSYFEMMKSLVMGDKGPKDIQGRIDAIGKIAMLGIVTYVIYPELDKMVKQMTGNKNAYVRRAGASTFIYNTQNLAQGKEDFTSWLTSVITPSVLASLPLDVLQGYLKLPTATELQANPVGTLGQTATNVASNLVSPLGYASNILSGKKSVGNTLLQFVGISTPSSTKSQQGVYDLIYNQKPAILTKVKELIASGDNNGALQLIETYNKNLANMFIGTLTDQGYSQSEAQNIFNQWLQSKDTKISSYFIKGISSKSMQTYNTKKSRTSYQNLILK